MLATDIRINTIDQHDSTSAESPLRSVTFTQLQQSGPPVNMPTGCPDRSIGGRWYGFGATCKAIGAVLWSGLVPTMPSGGIFGTHSEFEARPAVRIKCDRSDAFERRPALRPADYGHARNLKQATELICLSDTPAGNAACGLDGFPTFVHDRTVMYRIVS